MSSEDMVSEALEPMNSKPHRELDVIVPISLELDWPTKESTISDIRELNRQYGFTCFALACPCGGWRSVGYPPTEVFQKQADLFKAVRDELAPEGIVCGWWITLTVKSGVSDDFVRMTKADGSLTPFASCPLDPNFRRRIAGNMALFARVAKPAFIFTEDDYSIQAAAGRSGCFCRYHLDEFARRTGRRYTREDLVNALEQKTEESYALLRRWRELMKDTLVGLSQAIREAVDEDSPEIPIGYMQSGAADAEGDCTEAVARAMAGPRHTPFSRICGVFYGGVDAHSIPSMLYHPLYSRQHIQGDFHFLHESDTFPHTRFFTAGAHMRAMMGIVYSFGYAGSTFQVQQLLDKPNEETAYGRMFAAERARFTEAAWVASQCRVKGIELPFDPFWNTQEKSGAPEWLSCVSRFCIPYTSLDADVAFWDETCALHADDETVMRRLARGLFLDGNAAKALCTRGYGQYLGVEMGEDVAPGYQVYDLGEREVIRGEFAPEGKGRTMPSAHMLAKVNGTLVEVRPTAPACEVLSEAYTFQKKYLGAAMTRFQNSLGGRVVVMGLTVGDNLSQSLFNYRRQRLIQDMLVWCADKYVFVREAPDVFTIMNEAVDLAQSGFFGMLTLVNLCEDELEDATLHLPPHWQGVKAFRTLDRQGNWKPLACERRDGELVIRQALSYLMPMYILAE